jgi:hypothetical protein
MSAHQTNDQRELVDAVRTHVLAEQSGSEHTLVPIHELLRNKHIKVSFAEVAEYLLQVIIEKNIQEYAAPSTSPTGSALDKAE